MSEGIRVLAINSIDTDTAISPMIRENITTGFYPIIRPLYQYTNGLATGKLLDYLLFEWSEEGQAIVKDQWLLSNYSVLARIQSASNSPSLCDTGNSLTD